MNTTDLVHYRSADVPRRHAAPRPALAPSQYELAAPVRSGILRARHYLIGEQRLDGSWAGRKTGEVSSLSPLVLLLAYLERERSELAEQAARAIQRDQRPEGGWSLTPGGPIDVAASVLAYFALKLVGADASQPHMSRARQAIRQRGGADACHAATRLWLAVLGQVDYELCAPIAPEWLLTSACTGDLSATDNRRLAALSVVWALRPRRDVELARGVCELFVEQPRNWPKQAAYFAEQPSIPLARIWSRCERIGFVPFRKRALDKANSLLAASSAEPQGGDSDVAELAWQWIALAALGHAEDSRVIAARAIRLEQLVAVDADSDEARSQPDTSLTADTALAIEALVASGAGADEPPVAAGLRWLVDHRLQPVSTGRNGREVAAVLRAVTCLMGVDHSTNATLPPNIRLAARRSPRWADRTNRLPAIQLAQLSDGLLPAVRGRQRPDGGWSIGDRADENLRALGVLRASVRSRGAASAPAATGATLEMFSRHARPSSDPTIARAVAFLCSQQRGDGSWPDVAAGQLIHGTTWAIRGLMAAGSASTDSAVAAGVNWLLVHQQESGGWGEASGSSADGGEFVAAEATAIQTAGAVLALVAAGFANHDSTRRAIEFLVDHQHDDGTWIDTQLTERDSAAGACYRNDLHSSAWPLVALARWAVSIGEQSHDNLPAALRLICDEFSG